MKSGNGKKGREVGTKKPQLEPEDSVLWEHAVRDVEPLEKKDGRVAVGGPIRKFESLFSRDRFSISETEGSNFITAGYELDRNTDERLRRGLMPIDARLDLHCMTQDKAYAALQNFVRQGYGQGLRCVLVITGTGVRHRREQEHLWYEQSPGILRERVPQWLREGKMGGMVLRFYPAQRRHGGDGAFYVLLRRKRDG